jgi:hypothetical protein
MVDIGVAVTAVPTDVGVEVGTTATASQHHHTITIIVPQYTNKVARQQIKAVVVKQPEAQGSGAC